MEDVNKSLYPVVLRGEQLPLIKGDNDFCPPSLEGGARESGGGCKQIPLPPLLKGTLIGGFGKWWEKFLPWGRLLPARPASLSRRVSNKVRSRSIGRGLRFASRGKDFFVSVCSLHSLSRNDKLWSKSLYPPKLVHCIY